MKLSEVLPKATVTLRLSDQPQLHLRSITASDGKFLRTWKNAHRDSFFHREEIRPAAQQKWMDAYFDRPNDFMFMVLLRDEPIGCMGFRIQDGAVDIYNVILGQPDHGGQGHMSAAFRELCRYACRFSSHIELKVLKANPAKTWYERNGFRVSSEEDHYFLLSLDPVRLQSHSLHEENV